MNRKQLAKYFLPPIITASVLLFTFFLFSQYPFGDKTLVWCDLKQQSVPLLAIFRDALLGKSSLFYSFSQAGGVGIFPALCFFVLSPFSLISLLFEASELMFAANIIIAVKLAFAAFCAAVFFSSFHPKLTILQSSSFSVMYSLCGFALQYFQTLTWLDTLMIFPLLMVALKKLLIKRNPLAFIVLLAYAMITGFYLSVMLVIFLVFAVLFYLIIFLPKGERHSPAALFTLSGIASALLASPVLIPCFKAYINSARSSGFTEKLSSVSGTGPIFTKLPLIMCSAIVVPFVFWYFLELSKHSTQQKRRYYFVLLTIMLIPFFAEKINVIWHMGSYQAFPCRFAYITALILLSICAESLTVMEKKKNAFLQTPSSKLISGRIKYKILPVLLPILLAAFAVYFSIAFYRNKKQELTVFSRALWGDEKSFLWILAAFTVFGCVWGILILLYNNCAIARKIFSLFFAVICVTECGFNSAVYLGNIHGGENAWQKAFEMREQLEIASEHDEEYFRVKTKNKLFDVNWLAAMGYNSLGHYTSLTDEDYLYTMKHLGYSGYWMEIGSHGSSFFADGLLCNKYTINDDCSFDRNEYFMGLGIITNERPPETLPALSRPEIQNALFNNITNSDIKLFTEYFPSSIIGCEIDYPEQYYSKYNLTLNKKEATISYTVSVDERRALYFDCFDTPSNKLSEKINNSFSVSVNGKTVAENYPTQKLNGMLFLGEFENETVEIKLHLFKNISSKTFGVFGLDTGLLENINEKVVSGVLSTEATAINGSFTADNNGWLTVQIPFDDGFTATVNGKHTEVSKAYGTFMAIPISAGENTVSIKYFPAGMKLALVLFVIGCGVAFLLSHNKFHAAENIKITVIFEKIVALLFFFAAVFLFLLFHVAVWFV